MHEKILLEAADLERKMRTADENIQFVDSQISELEEFRDGVKTLQNSKESEIFSSFGKGVYVKSKLQNKDLFVDVGAGVVMKKTPEETLKIIEDQLNRLRNARMQLLSEIDSSRTKLLSIINKLESNK